MTFTVNNPAPTASSISPSTCLVGATGFTLTVTGSDFISSSVINWNGTPLTTTYVSATSLTASVPANLVASSGTANVTVTNASPGGGTSSPALTFTITAAPTISSISPDTATAGDPDTTITITGTNYQTGIEAEWNGTPFTTIIIDPQDAGAVIPASDLTAAGTFNITVVNPDTGASSAYSFTVNNPVPTTSSMSPASMLVGSADTTLSVAGTGFVSSSVVNWNGSPLATTYVSSTSLTATIPSGDLASSGTASVTVTNGTPGGGTSNPALTFTITSAPTISSVTPNSATVGDPDTSIAISGTGFESGATVDWNGTALTTTFTDPQDLSATVPAADLTTAGTFNITVVNPDTGTSSTATFTVNDPAPTTTSMSPSSCLFGAPGFTLTVTGTGFVSSSVVNWNGTSLSTTFVSSTSLTASVPSSDVTSTGTASITVSSPSPGGGTSSPVLTFTITADPTISSLTPNSATVGDPDTSIGISGTGFESGAVVDWNGTPLSTSFVNASDLTATIPSADLTAAGTFSITVVNPDTGTSTASTFTVNNPSPTATSLAPTSVLFGSAGFNLAVTGTGFVSSSVINWNGTPLSTTLVNSTTLVASLPTGDLASPGTASVTVTNGTPGGGTSSPALTFTITNNPSISSVTPSSATAGDPDTSIAISGTGFEGGANIDWNGTPLSRIYIDSSDMTATIPSADLTTAGTFSITVVNPDTGTSSASTFTVNNPLPTTTSLSPSTCLFGSSTFTMTVTGTNFVSGSTVNWNGSGLPTTFVNSTTLHATVQLGFLASPNTASVTVTNPAPGGGSSTPALSFVVTDIPTISSVSPNFAMVGDPDTVITVTGTGFENGAVAQWNGTALVTTVESATELLATIPAADLTTAGTDSITILNPDLGLSTGATFTVNNYAPGSFILTPSSAIVGASTFTLTLNGTAFEASSVVNWNGVPLSTTYVSAAQVTATVPSSDLHSAGTASVTVVTPSPGGGTSSAATFTIKNPFATPSSISPTSIVAASVSFVLTVHGGPFVQGATILFGGSPVTTTFVNSTTLTAVISPVAADVTGTYLVGAVNPAPVASGVAVTKPFTIISTPMISSVSPNRAAWHGPQTTITVTGSGFQNGARVTFDGMHLTSTYISATSITAVVPTTYLANSGIATVQVVNPDTGVSNTAQFTVGVQPPAIGSLSPSVAVQQTNAMALTINGSGFVNGARAQYDGMRLAVTFVSSSQLTASIPAEYMRNPGTAVVRVINPNGDVSSVGQLVVKAAPPAITTVTPVIASAGGGSVTITLNGSWFQSGARAQYDGQRLAVTFVSSGKLTAVIPAEYLRNAGVANIQVFNPDSQASNIAHITVGS